MKLYTVARTVMFYFEVEADSEEEALTEAGMLGCGAAVEEDQVTQEVIYCQETA